MQLQLQISSKPQLYIWTLPLTTLILRKWTRTQSQGWIILAQFWHHLCHFKFLRCQTIFSNDMLPYVFKKTGLHSGWTGECSSVTSRGEFITNWIVMNETSICGSLPPSSSPLSFSPPLLNLSIFCCTIYSEHTCNLLLLLLHFWLDANCILLSLHLYCAQWQ